MLQQIRISEIDMAQADMAYANAAKAVRTYRTSARIHRALAVLNGKIINIKLQDAVQQLLPDVEI